VFVTIGLIYALSLKNEFTAHTIFIPQVGGSKSSSGLSGLASLAGIDLSGMEGSSSNIPPSLYPQIVKSVSFKKAVLGAKIYVKGLEDSVSYQEYYEKVKKPSLLSSVSKYTIGLPSLIIKTLRAVDDDALAVGKDGSKFIKLTKQEVKLIKTLNTQLAVTVNSKEGFVKIEMKMKDAMIAAQMAQFVQDKLQQELINFRISKSRDQQKFTEVRYKEKKKEFEVIQDELAEFRDRNKNISTAVMMNEVKRLESEYNLAFSVYTELAKQLEQAKIQVSKQTPIFSIIQPVTIPSEKSGPFRAIILIGWFFFGIISSVAYILGKDYVKNLVLVK
jgi:hypothetical protein